ncbi:MAG: ATP-binding protein [Patescibacteria group bacterium]
MERVRKNQIVKDLGKKMVFLVGPRQVGKTWLSREIAKMYAHPMYFNYDNPDSREALRKSDWLPDTDLLILDEIHKMRGWKNFVKGLFDTKKESLHLLVTGSAKLDAHRHAGDSLAGRYFKHTLLPFTLLELEGSEHAGNMQRLFDRGGFPEPFLAPSIEDVSRWRSGYADSILREDAVDMRGIDNVYAFRSVFELLKTKVGSPISYSNIARDVGVSSGTVKRYIQVLEALYVVFMVRPYSHKIARSILKEPKVYFYDYGFVEDKGARFENMLALELLAFVHTREDLEGKKYALAFLKTKQGHEVDFAVVNEKQELEKLIEAKLTDIATSASMRYFTEKYAVPGVQVVMSPAIEKKAGLRTEVRGMNSFVKTLQS